MVCEPSLREVVSTDWLQLVVPLAVTAAFESTRTVTEAMPAMLDAEPVTVMAPETNAPADGDEIETAGGELLKVRETEVVEAWPTESVAIAKTV
jgi:hypothetical protein